MNTAVYPVTTENLALFLALREMRPEWHITTAVIPNAFAKDCHPGDSVMVCHRLAELPQGVDTVVVLSFWNSEKLMAGIHQLMLAGKAIRCYAGMDEKMRREILLMGEKAGVSVEIPDPASLLDQIRRKDEIYMQQESIVVAIGAMTKGLDTSSSVIELQRKLTELGYHVSVVAANPDLRAFGFDYLSISDRVKQNLDETVMMINRYLTFHQFISRSDIVIFQLPDEGLHRLSDACETCFGALTYLVSQAASIDYGILLSPVLAAPAEMYRNLSEIAEKRYGFRYDCVRILPRIIDDDTDETDTVRYCRTDEQIVSRIVAELRNSTETGDIDILFTDDRADWAVAAANHMMERLS